MGEGEAGTQAPKRLRGHARAQGWGHSVPTAEDQGTALAPAPRGGVSSAASLFRPRPETSSEHGLTY